MFKYTCLNAISEKGTSLFGADFEKTEDIREADAVMIRSASMHEMELPPMLEAVARAGAGVNNIPLEKCAEQGIVVFNTPGANANGVKELVLAGLLLASRDIIGGVAWVQSEKDSEDLGKRAEKEKKHFAGCELKGKKLGIIGLGAIGVLVANAAVNLDMEVYGYDPYISVDGAGDTFILKTKFCVVGNQGIFTGQDKTFSPLVLCCPDRFPDQFSGIALFPVGRERIDTEDHLPCAVFVVHGSFLIHFIGQILFIRDKAINKGDELVIFEHQPEIVTVIPETLRKFLLCGSFGRRKAFCFNRSNRIQIGHNSSSYYFHTFLLQN